MDTETALLWGFVVLLVLVLITIFGLLVHSGIFTYVEVKTCKPDIGEIFIAYKFARGPYNESGALFTQMHTLLPEYRTVGVFYDDPKMKQPQKLRYIVGLILAENGSAVNQEHQQLLKENGYGFATFPAIDHAVQTTFPFNSTISIVVAVMKVYPALREYVEARSLCARPFLEIYNNEKAEIVFVGPLAQQDDFYVPEVELDEDEDHQNDYDDDDRTENSSRSWNESASFARGDSECSDGDESLGHPPTPQQPPPSHISQPSDSHKIITTNITTTHISTNTTTAYAIPSQPSPQPSSSSIPPLQDDVTENPTPARTPTHAPAPAPAQVDIMPPPSTLPSVAPVSHVPAAAAVPTPPTATPPPNPPTATPPPPVAAATPPPVPAVSIPTPPETVQSPPALQMPPPPSTSMPPPTPPVTPATPTPVELIEAIDTAESGSLGGEESDANTGSSFEEIDEREAAMALLAGGGEGNNGNVKKDEDEGER